MFSPVVASSSSLATTTGELGRQNNYQHLPNPAGGAGGAGYGALVLNNTNTSGNPDYAPSGLRFNDDNSSHASSGRGYAPLIVDKDNAYATMSTQQSFTTHSAYATPSHGAPAVGMYTPAGTSGAMSPRGAPPPTPPSRGPPPIVRRTDTYTSLPNDPAGNNNNGGGGFVLPPAPMFNQYDNNVVAGRPYNVV